MPGGLDEAAAITSLVSVCVSLLDGCIKGLILLSKARSYRSDFSSISLLIDLQLLHLHAWASETGLTGQPPVLLVDAQYAAIVPRVLQRLNDLTSNLETLTRRHGLRLEATSEEIGSISNEGVDAERLIAESQKGFKQFLATSFRRRKEPWQILRWVVYDEQKMRNLGDDIRRFMDELHNILDRPRQANMAASVESSRRNAILCTSNEPDLDMIDRQSGTTTYTTAVAAAARLKKQGLLLGVLDIGSRGSISKDKSTKTGEKIPDTRLTASALYIANYHHRVDRYLAQYDGHPVLVEFKDNSVLRDDLLRLRVRKVSAFLRDLDPSFHGLPCRGYVEIHHRYAYIFNLRDSIPSVPATSIHTLWQFLREVPTPSLNLRLSFAIVLLETLLQLHTSGWLHKELRSENVIFLGQPAPSSSQDLLTHKSVYIAGYTLAREDDCREVTEPLKSEIEADLYRHPSSLGPARESYRKAFDVFSIGCMLLEIGTWRRLSSLLQESSAGSETKHPEQHTNLLALRHRSFFSRSDRKTSQLSTRLKSDVDRGILRRLDASMGEGYTRIVRQLISAADHENDVAEGNRLLRLEMDSLERVRAMAEVV